MATLRQTRDYFDTHAGDLDRDSLVDKWRAIEPMFGGVPSGAPVLECGAGTGLYTVPMLDAGYEVTSIDLSRRSLELVGEEVEARGLGNRHTAVEGDFVEQARSLDRRFEAVAFIKVLHHFPDAGSIAAAVGEAAHVLAPGGRVVIFEPNGAGVFWPLVMLAKGKEYRESEKNYRLIRRRPLVEACQDAGLTDVTVSYRFLVPGMVAGKARALDGVDRALCRVPGMRRVAGNIAIRATAAT